MTIQEFNAALAHHFDAPRKVVKLEVALRSALAVLKAVRKITGGATIDAVVKECEKALE